MSFDEALKEHLENSPLATVQWNKDFKVSYWSGRAEKLFGWKAEEVLGKSPDNWSFIFEGDKPRVSRVMEDLISNRQARNFCPNRNYTKQGDVVHCDWYNSALFNASGELESILSLVLDVTFQKELEERYQRAQRLENIALLTGGISHDMNNILAPISLGVELIQRQTDNPNILSTLDIISRSVDRGSHLIRHILGFSRGMEGEPELIDPSRLLKDVEEILKLGLPKKIRLDSRAESSLHPLFGNSTQLNQILVNLAVNARDSMVEGGELSLSAYNYPVKEPTTLQSGTLLAAGEYVVFEVKDTGEGIPEAIQAKVFEPFFSTKSSTKGTGLGLSNSQMLAEKAGGGLDFISSRKTGTTFRFYFPASLPEAATGEVAKAAQSLAQGNGETILVVDDEKSIRRILQSLLEINGFQCITAADGVIALGKLHAQGDAIRLVVTDVDMPNIDGVGLVRTMKSMGLDHIPILTFYGSATEKEHKLKAMRELGVRSFLKKPFESRRFLSLVGDFIQEGDSAGRRN